MARSAPSMIKRGRFPVSNRGEQQQRMPHTALTSIPEADVLPFPPQALDQEILATVLPEIDAFQKQQFEQLWSHGVIHVEKMWHSHAARVAQMQSHVAEFVEGSKKLEEESRAIRELMVQALACIGTMCQEQQQQQQQQQQQRGAQQFASQPAHHGSVAPQEPLDRRPAPKGHAVQVEAVELQPAPAAQVGMVSNGQMGLRDSSSLFNCALNGNVNFTSDIGVASDGTADKLTLVSSVTTPECVRGSGVWNACEESLTVAAIDSFSLTMRRIEDTPFGFMVRVDGVGDCLTVEKVMSNSVVAAWNAQNVGERREILRNDRITSVNGKGTVEDMRHELANARLLKLVIERTASAGVHSASF